MQTASDRRYGVSSNLPRRPAARGGLTEAFLEEDLDEDEEGDNGGFGQKRYLARSGFYDEVRKLTMRCSLKCLLRRT